MILILKYDCLVHEKGWNQAEQDWYQDMLEEHILQYADPDAEP
jgi:hypothetical protein